MSTVWNMVAAIVTMLDNMTEAEQVEFFSQTKDMGRKIGLSTNPVDDLIVENVVAPNLKVAIDKLVEGIKEGRAELNTPQPDPVDPA